MSWLDLEQSFNRAFFLSFSKRKCLLAFPVLVLCGIFIVFCRAIAFESTPWLAMSLAFLPILLSSGVLLALGVLLIRMHEYESKQIAFTFKSLIYANSDLLVATFYLSVPPLLAYLCLWILSGIFFLLGEIPLIGSFFSIVFSFGPFLLLFGSLLLCLFNLGLLFFVTPAVTLQRKGYVSLAKRLLGLLKQRFLSSLILLLVALLPIAALAALLSFAAVLANFGFSVAEKSLSVALEWFFIMVPFCALLTPAVVFFFNFAAETHQLLRGGKCA